MGYTHVSNGQFLESLYTVREALRAFPERIYSPINSNMTIKANAWVTDLQLDQQAGNLSFFAQSSPTTEIHIELRYPEDFFVMTPSVTVNNVPIAIAYSSDGTIMQIEFVLSGGSHQVQVMSP